LENVLGKFRKFGPLCIISASLLIFVAVLVPVDLRKFIVSLNFMESMIVSYVDCA